MPRTQRRVRRRRVVRRTRRPRRARQPRMPRRTRRRTRRRVSGRRLRVRRTRRGAASLGGGGFAKRGGGVQRGGKAPSEEEIKQALKDYDNEIRYYVKNQYSIQKQNIREKIKKVFYSWDIKSLNQNFNAKNINEKLKTAFNEIKAIQRDKLFGPGREKYKSKTNNEIIKTFDKTDDNSFDTSISQNKIAKYILDNDVFHVNKQQDTEFVKGLKFFVFNVDENSLKEAISDLLDEVYPESDRPNVVVGREVAKKGQKANCKASKDPHGLVWCGYDKDEDELTRELEQNENRIKNHDTIHQRYNELDETFNKSTEQMNTKVFNFRQQNSELEDKNRELIQKNQELEEVIKESFPKMKRLIDENRSLIRERDDEPSNAELEYNLRKTDKTLKETRESLPVTRMYQPRRKQQPPPGEFVDMGVPDANFFQRTHSLSPRRNR